MSRNLADLQNECKRLGLTVTKSGKREAKSDYEKALRDYYWERDGEGQPMVEQIQPMLARNVKDVTPTEAKEMWTDGNKWAYQEKINGCRAVLIIRNPSKGQINQMTSRRLSDETYRLNELHDVVPHYRDMNLGDEWADTVVDGELLMPVPVVDTGSVITADILQATAATMNCGSEKSIAIQAQHGKLVLHAFDCLRFKGKDIRSLPYEQRHAYLAQVVARVAEVLGELPCEHCSGIRRAPMSELADATIVKELPPENQVDQDNFLDIING
jgi:ATP-dependent DNA ligase